MTNKEVEMSDSKPWLYIEQNEILHLKRICRRKRDTWDLRYTESSSQRKMGKKQEVLDRKTFREWRCASFSNLKGWEENLWWSQRFLKWKDVTLGERLTDTISVSYSIAPHERLSGLWGGRALETEMVIRNQGNSHRSLKRVANSSCCELQGQMFPFWNC